MVSAIFTFNKLVDELNLLGQKTASFGNYDSRNIIFVIVELMSLLKTLGDVKTELLKVEPDFTGLCGIFTNFPKSPSHTIYRLMLLLESIRNFCCLNPDDYHLNSFNYEIDSDSPAYSNIVIGVKYSSNDEPGLLD